MNSRALTSCMLTLTQIGQEMCKLWLEICLRPKCSMCVSALIIAKLVFARRIFINKSYTDFRENASYTNFHENSSYTNFHENASYTNFHENASYTIFMKI